jgi:LuxR family transcriptional regulator, quorum-sensing system regulator BjaR1
MGTTGQDKYARLAFEFCETVAAAPSNAVIGEATVRALKDFGLDHVTCAVVPSPGFTPLNGILLNNRPIEFLTRYAEKGYAEKDPAVTELKHTLRPYSWGDIKNRRLLSKEQLDIMGEAVEFGATDGLVIPIATLSGALSIFAPCGDKPNLSDRARSAVEIIGMASHQALSKAAIRITAQSPKRLTPREREVLHWVASGKTDEEIGLILHVGRTTVLQHVENAKRKLNAYGRTLAVVEALRRGEISI